MLAGIDAAQAAGLKVKINAVALKGVNEDEIAELIDWAHGRGMDLTLIEMMPLGEIGADRLEQYLPLSLVRARLAERFTLDDIDYRTGGPARYVRVAETGGRLGFITPMTHNFCEILQSRARHLHRHALSCVSARRTPPICARRCAPRKATICCYAAIDEAIARKPKGHDFIIDRRHSRPAVARHMSVTGG